MNAKPTPKVLYSGNLPWRLQHIAGESYKSGALSQLWLGTKRPSGLPKYVYRRIWPYYVSQKAFWHLPLKDLEERMRWKNLNFYDMWVRSRHLPSDCTVVYAPMGACLPLFQIADQQRPGIFKVFDAPNTHPAFLKNAWQGECDIFSPGYTIPIPDWAFARICTEIEQADMIMCTSDFVRQTMVDNGVPNEKCFVNPAGVDRKVFQPRKAIPSNPTFICVGSISLRKGHQYLFRAFSQLRKDHPEARLVCIGDIRPDFKQEWGKWSDIVQHHEHLTHSEVSEHLKISTAFVLASVEEGFAKVISEAMACGLPIIATRETGAESIITNNKEGYIIPSRSVDALIKHMSLLAVDRGATTTMGENSINRITKEFTWEKYTYKLIQEISQRL